MIYFLVLVLITSCYPSCPERTERYQEAIRVRGKYAEFAVEQGLKPFGFGEGVSGDIENLNLSFIDIGNYTLEEARVFMVYQAENFLRIINEDRKIRPHLHEFPATSKLIELDIAFKDEKNLNVSLPFISFVLLSGSKVSYWVEDGSRLGKKIHQETYEEALEWVKLNAPEALLPRQNPIEIQ